MIEISFYILLIINTIVFFILLFNFFTAPKLKNEIKIINNPPFISILIPARNEENNIANCLNSLLTQTYQNIEIIVLDDFSSDNTYCIAQKIAEKSDKIKIIKGEPLPENWKGKNWACNLLQKQAKGEYLLFMDADVTLSENALYYAIYLVKRYKLDALSAFPTQKTLGLGEKIIVPLMKWLLLSFLPLKLVYLSKNKAFIAANGQFFLFKKKIYNSIGGHKSVAGNVVEDMGFALLLKQNNYKIMTALGNNAVFCKMYDSFKSAFWGFSKNYFPGFRISPILFLFLQLIFLSSFVLPVFLMFYNTNFLIIVLLIILGRVLLAIITKDNIIFSILLHIIQILVLVAIGINSVISTKKNRILWKGRKI